MQGTSWPALQRQVRLESTSLGNADKLIKRSLKQKHRVAGAANSSIPIGDLGSALRESERRREKVKLQLARGMAQVGPRLIEVQDHCSQPAVRDLDDSDALARKNRLTDGAELA